MAKHMRGRMCSGMPVEGRPADPLETGLGQLNDERFAMLVDGRRLLMQQRGEVFDHFARALQGIAVDRVLEVGTADGALIVGLRELLPEAELFTVDIKMEPWFEAMFGSRHIQFSPNGYLADEVREFVARPGMLMVLCDGVDKIAEFKYFAPLLKPGDIICAHDYLGFTEHLLWHTGCISVEDVGQVCLNHDLVPFKPEIFGVVVWLAMRKEG